MMEISAETLFKCLQSQASFDAIRPLLDKLQPDVLINSRDGSGLDVLQAAIVANQTETVQYLFLRRLFTEYTHQPHCNSYLHLAVQQGSVSLVQILLENRPSDFRTVSTLCYPEPCRCDTISGSGSGSTDTDRTPLEVAVKFQKLKCLKLLLQCELMETKLDSELERACELNFHEGMELLLTEPQPAVVVRRAYEQAVRRKLAKCIQCVAGRLGDCGDSFNGLNPYHVMYQYSSGFTFREDYCVSNQFVRTGLAECTRTLIEQHFPVHVKTPSNTYPLYTLLHSIFSEFCQYPSKDQLQCVSLLLDAGADPNFDEIHSVDKLSLSSTNAFGRGSYASALHAVAFDPYSPGQTWDMSKNITTLLFQHGANPYQQSADCQMTPLSDFLQRLCETDLDEYQLIMDDSELEMMGMAEAVADVIRVYYSAMTNSKFNHSINTVINRIAGLESLGEMITQQIESIRRKPKSLLDLSRLAVWESVGRSQERLKKVELPRSVENSIVNLFT